ncbi:unnamed protein product [Citrullus colocynthis]|uniref:C2 domain-containing protein n=1 Tax=Citrullus colocynthis TaxID=252529 RepID=A0ABP0YSD2_9ROSI
MGNCFSNDVVGRSAIGGTAFSQSTTSNIAIDCFLLSRGYRGLYSQIELSFSASNLRDGDMFSKSDPMVVIYTKGRDGTLEELHRTEVVQNSLNPKWIHKLNITYQFEVVQTLVFFVYDVDTQYQNLGVKMLKLDEQQYLGEATCVLSEIVTQSDRSLTLDLVYREESTSSTLPHHCGKLTVHAEECVSSKTTTEMILRCSDLEHKDLFSRIDPFLVISKIVESKSSIPVCKTEVIKNDLNPTWKPVFLNMQQVGSKKNRDEDSKTATSISSLLPATIILLPHWSLYSVLKKQRSTKQRRLSKTAAFISSSLLPANIILLPHRDLCFVL